MDGRGPMEKTCMNDLCIWCYYRGEALVNSVAHHRVLDF